MVKITLNLHSSGRMNRSVEVIQKVQNSCFITSFTKEFCLHINPPHATSDGHTIFICMYYSCVFKNSILGIWTLLLQTSPLLQFRLNLWQLVILLCTLFNNQEVNLRPKRWWMSTINNHIVLKKYLFTNTFNRSLVARAAWSVQISVILHAGGYHLKPFFTGIYFLKLTWVSFNEFRFMF